MHHRNVPLLLGLLLFCPASPTAAHDFWLQPSQYWVAPALPVSVTLQVGHGEFRQRSPIALQRITRFQAVAPQGTSIDLHDRLRLGQAIEDGNFTLRAPGLYVIVLQTDDHAQSHLPAIRFNDYVRVEGLTPASDYRTRLNRMETDGSERYSRCAKSLVQVGDSGTETQSQVNKPVGLPLEIVPEVNPYAMTRFPNFPVTVIYLGQPLAGALVKLTNLKDDARPLEMHLTDRDGRASFAMPSSGSWLLNVIWTRALPASEETEFETVFSSLSFGFPSR